MKKANSILAILLSTAMLFGCGVTDEATIMVPAEEADTSSAEATTDKSVVEESVAEASSTENTVAAEAGSDASGSASTEEYDIQAPYKEVRYVSIIDSYDPNDQKTMENGMWTRLENAEDEKEFLSYFFTDPAGLKVTEEANAKLYMGTLDDKNVFVALMSYEDTEYPKDAYGFKYSLDNYEVVAKYDATKTGDEIYDTILSPDGSDYYNLDTLKPLLDYQKKEYFKDDNGKVVKVKYDSDPFEHGTYNSTGILYYDSKERPFYRDYMVTNGGRRCYYFYDGQGALSQILDFGGMPYKGMEGNDDISIGVDFEAYTFER